MFCILRVNMTDLTVKNEDIPEAYQGLGGRVLTSAIVSAEVEPTCNAIGPNNKLVFAPETECAIMSPFGLDQNLLFSVARWRTRAGGPIHGRRR